MKKIKVVFVLVVFVFSGISYAQAQGGGRQGGPKGPPPIPNTTQIKKMVKELSTELSLSDEQETKVSAVYTAHFDAVKAKTKVGAPIREEMEKLKVDFEKEVKSLLTTEQKKLYIAYLKKQNNQANQQRPNR